MTDFQEISYRKHTGHLARHGRGEPRSKQAETWLLDDTVNAWRHHRMYATVDPFLHGNPGATWLTVGDGSWGNDAHYLHLRGAKVTATDISDVLLREAYELGRIPDFRQENAEKLSFEDGTFDYVLCKEAYHHFPRPPLALHEMLRVAARGVVLIEPNDQYATDTLSILLSRKVNDGFKRL